MPTSCWQRCWLCLGQRELSSPGSHQLHGVCHSWMSISHRLTAGHPAACWDWYPDPAGFDRVHALHTCCVGHHQLLAAASTAWPHLHQCVSLHTRSSTDTTRSHDISSICALQSANDPICWPAVHIYQQVPSRLRPCMVQAQHHRETCQALSAQLSGKLAGNPWHAGSGLRILLPGLTHTSMMTICCSTCTEAASEHPLHRLGIPEV